MKGVIQKKPQYLEIKFHTFALAIREDLDLDGGKIEEVFEILKKYNPDMRHTDIRIASFSIIFLNSYGFNHDWLIS